MKIRVTVAIDTAVREYWRCYELERGTRLKNIRQHYRFRRFAAEGALLFLSNQFPEHGLWRHHGTVFQHFSDPAIATFTLVNPEKRE